MSQAYTTVEDWKMFSDAFEKFSEMVTSLRSSHSQQSDHGQIGTLQMPVDSFQKISGGSRMLM
jgi:hypothetical protein